MPGVLVHKAKLGQTGMELSRLGFGCARLTAQRDEADAVAILEHAFSRGITHFDVARVYGFGRAETILGKFLHGKRGRVTVATKFGLSAPAGLAQSQLAISMAKKLLGPFPGILRRLKRYGAARVVESTFSPQAAVESLQNSLRAMGTDYVDLYLLHEATASQAMNESLVDTLEREVQKGTIKTLGVASSLEKLEGKADSLPAAYRVLQFENHVAKQSARSLLLTTRGLITHSTFAALRSLAADIRADPALTSAFSARVGLDLRDPEVQSSLLMRYALDTNPSGVVLFSSEAPAHVDRNVRCAEQQPLDPQQMETLCELLDAMTARRSSPVGAARP